MQLGNIKNVVFDIGNVMVRWSPIEVVRLTFGNMEDMEQYAKDLFHSRIWVYLNKGLVTEAEAKHQYQASMGLSESECERLFYYVKHSQILLFGSVDLLKRVKAAGYGVYALTDNVVKTVEYLQSTYDFWSEFDGVVVSANIGVMKPQAEIYQLLLCQYDLTASETVFIDDMSYNVEGAEAVGMPAIQFKNAEQCELALKELGLSF
ncbi:Alpha-D-glucose-1-phosphate phosphatase YihX [Marinomonas spartinae]|uniref:Alpha-D-glucose-1-phosphate phosphatase YihX n=1 Tax=Marinomonas spartinae TaxID=1792290 RepID=A0A1A8THC9_9GAMM|nr:HAD family phosphatase [Marinomonas spartinae]SBS31745.1 Alpha-D-glucose-1-phosphate phosphatase YihX [Marinomonas spartinae]